MSVNLDSVGGYEFDVGYAGGVPDGSLVDRISRTLESGTLAWGAPVATGDTGGCVSFDDTHQQFVGIAEKNPMHPQLAGVAAYAQYDAVSVLQEGPIYIVTSEAANDGDALMLIYDSSTHTVAFGSASGGKEGTSGSVTRTAVVHASFELQQSGGAVGAGAITRVVLRASRAVNLGS
jgi:hypothetical protein